jgi:hypothetical protein
MNLRMMMLSPDFVIEKVIGSGVRVKDGYLPNGSGAVRLPQRGSLITARAAYPESPW